MLAHWNMLAMYICMFLSVYMLVRTFYVYSLSRWYNCWCIWFRYIHSIVRECANLRKRLTTASVSNPYRYTTDIVVEMYMCMYREVQCNNRQIQELDWLCVWRTGQCVRENIYGREDNCESVVKCSRGWNEWREWLEQNENWYLVMDVWENAQVYIYIK